ncbi:MAG: transcription initiation protein [Bacteroidetes bacterium]|nr:transcription initiation protein [Bacteroidota bacterium]
MDEYIVLMRLDLITKEKQPTPDQLKVYMEYYQDWVNGIIAQDKFVGGTGLDPKGKVIRPGGVITDGPFAEIKESLAGFIIIRAASLEEAVEMAKGNPILNGEGNSVEVRRINGQH